MPTIEMLDTAEAALKAIYPGLTFSRRQITPQAAAFAFKVIVKVDITARISAGLFSFVRVYNSWVSIPQTLAKAAYKILNDRTTYQKNKLSWTSIGAPHRRNVQMHLQQPDIFPCPDFRF